MVKYGAYTEPYLLAFLPKLVPAGCMWVHSMSSRRSDVRLDEKDIKLISILRRDGRISYSKLASMLGVSESAIRKRIAKLMRMGVIERFTIEYRLPGEIQAIILVRTQPPTPVPEVSHRILKHVNVDHVYEVTGEYDIVVIARASSTSEINRIIDFIRSIPGVAGTYTMIVLRSY